MFDEEKQTGDQYWETESVFCDDKVEEIFPSNYPSEYTYNNSYDESDPSNGKSIYIFEPTQKFKYLVFTDAPELLNGEMIKDPYFYNIYSSDITAGWKNWKNGEGNSSEPIYGTPVHFIDFVNVPKWSSVSMEVITKTWNDGDEKYDEAVQSYPMTKLSEKAADCSDVYRFILPDEITANNSDVTIRFTNGSASSCVRIL